MDSVPVFGLLQKLTLNSGPQVFEDSDTLPEFTEGLSKQTFRQKWFLGQVLHIMLRCVSAFSVNIILFCHKI